MRALGYEELASHVQRVETAERLFVLHYRLVRERLGEGVQTYFVRCYQRELRDGRPVGAEAEVAGLGPDGAQARTIYESLVVGGAMPVHLQDIVREQRFAWELDSLAASRRPLHGAGPQPGQRRGV